MKRNFLLMLLMTLLPLAGWAQELQDPQQDPGQDQEIIIGDLGEPVQVGDYTVYLDKLFVVFGSNELLPQVQYVFKGGEHVFNFGVVAGAYDVNTKQLVTGALEFGTYYLKVIAEGNQIFVPFQVAVDLTDPYAELVDDEESWSDSYNGGAHRDYYVKYPNEDRWGRWPENSGDNHRGSIEGDPQDKYCSFDSYILEGENYRQVASGTVQMRWTNPATVGTYAYRATVSTNEAEEGYPEEAMKTAAGKTFWLSNQAKANDDQYWELFTDNTCTTSAGVYVRITGEWLGYVHAWLGAINSPRAAYPWMAVAFNIANARRYVPEDPNDTPTDDGLNNPAYRLAFRYNGEKDKMPYGDALFGEGYDESVMHWGVVSIPELYGGVEATESNTTYGNDDALPFLNGYDKNPSSTTFGDKTNDGGFVLSKFTLAGLPAEVVQGVVLAGTEISWTRTPASATYIGQKIQPIINVGDVPVGQSGYAVEYTWANPATNEVEVVDAPLHVGTYTVKIGYESEGGFLPVGSSKKFTVNKNTLEVVLQQIYMPYGTIDVSTLEPKWVVKKADEDKTPTDIIVVDRASLGEVVKGDNWAATDQPDELEPKAVRNYTTSSEPIAYVGRTYKQEVLTPGVKYTQEEIDAAQEGDPAYGKTTDDWKTEPVYKTNEDGDPIYTDEVDFPGYVDYVATTNTSSANIMVTKGTITITSDNFTKVYGYDDPAYMTATYQNEDSDAPFYTTDETKAGKKFFTAENQAGTDMTDVITIVRPDYKQKKAGSDEIDPTTEAVGKHTLGYILVPAETAHYNVVFVSSDAEQEEDPYLNIVKFNINDDVPPVIEEDPDDTDPEPTPEFKEKFIIEVANVEYNADRQYPDPKITFKHDVLGDIVLTKYVDDDPTKGVIGQMGQSKTEWYDAQEDYKYLKYPSAVIEDALISYGGTAAWPGSYGWNKYVNRDTDDPAIYLTNKAEVEVTAKGDRFEGTKSGFFSVTPAPLSVKVIDDKARDNQPRIYAGQFPNFGIELDDEVEESVTKYGWPAAEPAAKQTAVLTALGEAITAYNPAVEGAPNYNAETKTAYGYVGYDGKVTNTTDDPVVPYTITVAEAAKTAANVILAANNYTPVYASGDNTVVPIDLGFEVIAQEFDYATDGTNGTTYTYNTPTINTIVALEDKAAVVGEKWTQAEIEAAAEGDPAYGKTTDDWKVEPADAIQKSVNLTSGTLPDGVTINDLFSAIAFKDGNEITAACKTEGGLLIPHAGVLTLTKTAAADNPGYNITITNGNWTVKPLAEMHLDYANVGQALQDHQGFKMEKVWMPNRNLKNRKWYAMVLPFEISAPKFFSDNGLGYGAFEVQDEENTSANTVRFKLTIENIPANTPFILKVYEDWTAKRGELNSLCDKYFDTQFGAEGVTIATLPEGQAYNDLTKSPFTQDNNGKGTKFIGQYTGKGNTAETSFTDKERWMTGGEFKKGYPYQTFDPQNPEKEWTTYISPTTAYLQFASAEAAVRAQILIQEPDGSYTALKGVEADVEANANNAEGIFNLSGQRVNKAQKGIYIVNGKKVLVK